MRAIGGADLDQAGAGPEHDLGQTERATDLDQLAARNDSVPASGEGIEHQEHSAGVVVDEASVLRAGELAQEPADMVVALAAFTTAEVELKRHRATHGIGGG